MARYFENANVQLAPTNGAAILTFPSNYSAASSFGYTSIFLASATCGWIYEGALNKKPREKFEVQFNSAEKLEPGFKFYLYLCTVPEDLNKIRASIDSFSNVDMVVTKGTRFTALEWACRRGALEIVKILIEEYHADVNIGVPLVWACYTNNLEVAKHLVEKGVDPFKEVVPGSNVTAMHFAAENGSLDCLKWLIEDIGLSPHTGTAKGDDLLGHLENAVAPKNIFSGNRACYHWVRRYMEVQDQLRPGTQVIITGLKNGNRYNGCRGVVEKQLKTRFAVKIEGKDKVMSISQKNLRVLEKEKKIELLNQSNPAVEALGKRQQDCIGERVASFKALVDPSTEIRFASTNKLVKDFLYVKGGTRLIVTSSHDFKKEFKFFDPFSVAMELYTIMTGIHNTEWKYIEGGISYMEAERDWFWSMCILWRQFGTILPASATYSFERECLTGNELNRMGNLASEGHSDITSICLAAFVTGQEMQMHPFEAKSLPWLDDTTKNNNTNALQEDKRPQWVKDIAKIWDEALNEYRETRTLPCMFVNKPGGCAARDCAYIHSELWRKTVEHLKKYLFYMCNHCKGFAKNRCGKCQKAMYCSDVCFRADWIISHKYKCEG
jgi:hypothetical protein